MTKEAAPTTLEAMTDQEFNEFLASLPARVGMLVRSGFINWREALLEWYIKQQEGEC